MEKKTYNGWANYETWATKLWMDNSEGDQEFFREMTENVIKYSKPRTFGLTREECQLIDLSDVLRENFEENAPEVSGVYADLLNAALSEIDWREIAESLLTDVRNEVK